jgi:phenylacetate-CoA ligase
MKRQSVLTDTIAKRLASELGVAVEVKLVGKKTLERGEGKARRVLDRRTLG